MFSRSKHQKVAAEGLECFARLTCQPTAMAPAIYRSDRDEPVTVIHSKRRGDRLETVTRPSQRLVGELRVCQH